MKGIGAKAYFPFLDRRQGIVHVIGPESGATLPGMTVVCGDSHTSTHGAFGALAFGIGTSEVEHVLATQCLITKKARSMLIRADGRLARGVTAKDLVLAIIGRIGTAGGTGYAIEFGGDAVRALSMEGRMTMCNMSIEAGARAGMIGVDERTIDYVRGRPFAPAGDMFERAAAHWRTLTSDDGAKFDLTHVIDAASVRPQVTWGTSPEMVVSIEDRVPDPDRERDATRREGMERALAYMGLAPNTPVTDIRIDKVFIGSCTNSRIEDLRQAAAVVRGRRVARQRPAGARRARVGAGEDAGRSRGARSRLPRRRLRMARAGLLDVPRDERRSSRAGRALRVDVQPQFRRPAGRRRPHASRQPGDGGGRGGGRATSSTCGGSARRATVEWISSVAPRASEPQRRRVAMLKRIAALLALSGIALGLAACNTVAGAGKDVKATGCGHRKGRGLRQAQVTSDRAREPCNRFACTRGSSRRSTAPTSTPTRSSPSSS